VTTLVFNKPFDVVTGFTLPANAKPNQQTLADYIDVGNVWPVGRLDRDSEGLLILSSHPQLRSRLLDPKLGHPRTYQAQVEGDIASSPQALVALEHGVVIEGIATRPATASAIAEPAGLWPRTPPIRYRAAIPTSWLELTIVEGRNRQVRKMTAAVGFPTLRLLRRSILHLDVFLLGLAPGEWRALSTREEHELVVTVR
jgi:23S rRNA pseudouridine2457 synthase